MPKYTYLTPEDARTHMLKGGQCRYLDGGVVIYDMDQQRFKYRDQENGWVEAFDYLEKVECYEQVAAKRNEADSFETSIRELIAKYKAWITQTSSQAKNDTYGIIVRDLEALL